MSELRHLSEAERQELVAHGCYAEDWAKVMVSLDFRDEREKIADFKATR